MGKNIQRVSVQAPKPGSKHGLDDNSSTWALFPTWMTRNRPRGMYWLGMRHCTYMKVLLSRISNRLIDALFVLYEQVQCLGLGMFSKNSLVDCLADWSCTSRILSSDESAISCNHNFFTPRFCSLLEVSIAVLVQLILQLERHD